MFLVGFILVYFVLLGILITVGGSKRLFHHYPAAKTAASLGFLVLALAAFIGGGRTMPLSEFLVLFAALVLCAGGDILLGFANVCGGAHGRCFQAGVAVFGAAHLVFCVLYYTQSPFFWADGIVPLCALLATVQLERAGLLRLKKMRLPALCYSVLVGLMCSKAVSLVLVMGHTDPHCVLLALGSVLFMISDVVLVFMYFGPKLQDRHRHLARFWNLTAYYLGVLLIALATL
ncbi:MAG: lysoplasmalogenase family protein [Pygmaiobacter sp.]